MFTSKSTVLLIDLAMLCMKVERMQFLHKTLYYLKATCTYIIWMWNVLTQLNICAIKLDFVYMLIREKEESKFLCLKIM